MDPTEIIAIIQGAISIFNSVSTLIAEGRVVLSATDAQQIKDALAKAEAATDAIRPVVDAALDEAAQE